MGFHKCLLKQHALFGTFSAGAARLVGEAHDVLVLFVGHLKYLDIAPIGQGTRDSLEPGLEPFVQQKVAELPCRLALRLVVSLALRPIIQSGGRNRCDLLHLAGTGLPRREHSSDRQNRNQEADPNDRNCRYVCSFAGSTPSP